MGIRSSLAVRPAIPQAVMLPRMVETPRSAAPRAGHLLIIGGAEDKLRQRQILSRFVNLAGGHDARVVVISTASSLGDEATELYRSLFHAMGVGEVRGIRPLSREEANDPRLADLLDEATGIFMTGGNQLKLSAIVNGTAFGDAIRSENRIGDYRPVNGVLFPFSFVEAEIASGKEMNQLTIQSMEVNPTLPAGFFSPPQHSPTPLQEFLEQLYMERTDPRSVMCEFQEGERWTECAQMRVGGGGGTRT